MAGHPPRTDWPLVTVVVLNWNDASATEACLRSIRDSSYPNTRVVLVDNCSDPSDRALLEQRAVHLADQYVPLGKNLGFGGGNNEGVRTALESGTDYVLLLNNDATLHPDALRILVVEAQKNPRAGALAPLVLNMEGRIWFGGGRVSWLTGRTYHAGVGERPPPLGKEGDSQEIETINACCLLMPADVATSFPLRPEFFIYFEDADFSQRVLRRGRSLLYVPSARAYHRISQASGRKSPMYYYLFARNRIVFMKYNAPGWAKPVFYLFELLIRGPTAFVAIPLWSRNAACLRAYFEGLIEGLEFDPERPTWPKWFRDRIASTG